MKANMKIIRIAAFCAVLTACQSKPDKPISATDEMANSQEVTVTEMEPDDQLLKAIEEFSKHEHGQSAIHIKEAAKSMRLIAASASREHKVSIEQAAGGLEALARKVAHNQVKDIADFYHCIGKAGRALAGYRLNVVETEYFNHTETKSGAFLRTTIDHLENSIATHHRALNPEEKAILNNAVDVAARLQKGDKVDKDDLKRTLQSVDNEIEKWNTEFETM